MKKSHCGRETSTMLSGAAEILLLWEEMRGSLAVLILSCAFHAMLRSEIAGAVLF